MQDRQEAITKATVSIKTGEKKHEMENFSTFSIFCSQPLQVLLLDLAYSAAKSFRLFSALPPPSCSPPFPGEQSKYRVRLYYTFSYFLILCPRLLAVCINKPLGFQPLICPEFEYRARQAVHAQKHQNATITMHGTKGTIKKT